MDPMIISARLDLSKPANIIRLIIEDIISAIKVTSKVLKKGYLHTNNPSSYINR
jgi:hypothetical protein